MSNAIKCINTFQKIFKNQVKPEHHFVVHFTSQNENSAIVLNNKIKAVTYQVVTKCKGEKAKLTCISKLIRSIECLSFIDSFIHVFIMHAFIRLFSTTLLSFSLLLSIFTVNLDRHIPL